MSIHNGALATITAALLGLAPTLAAPPPQSQHAVRPGVEPKAAIERGLSLEHECLNAVRATRMAARHGAAPNLAAAHLDRAETAAQAGHGQLCQDELASATEDLP